MPTERVCIVGAGGHARVVADALLCTMSYAKSDIFFADDRAELHDTTILGCRVAGDVRSVVSSGMAFHVAIGDPDVRARLQEALVSRGAHPLTVVHPGALISAHAKLGSGSFVAAGAIVAAMATLGDGVIVNHGAVVDHDCHVGSWSHIAPHATLGGEVRIGARTLIGASATVLPGKFVGDGAIVGAGAVVVHDIPPGVVSVGIPARPKRGSAQ